MATQTLSEKILDFFNTVQDKYAIRYRIKADPDFGVAPESGYGIDLTTAEKILTKRNALGGAFSNIEEIDKVNGVGPVTLHNILYSFSDSLRAWTATADGNAVSTNKRVGIDTRVPEHALDVFDGSLAVRSRVAPEQVSNFSGTQNARGLFVSGLRAYIVEGTALRILSAPNLNHLASISISNGDAHDIFVEGSMAYIASGTQGIQRYDVSSPTSPTEKPGLDFDGTAQGVFVRGGLAYIANGSKGLWILDISDPDNPPIVVTSYDTGGDARDVFVAGNYAFVADGDEGLQVFDIEDFSNPPVLVTSFDTGGDARRVYIQGNHAYIADGSRGLRIIDISNPVTLQEVGSFVPTSQTEDVFVKGNMVYIAFGLASSGINISDFNNLAPSINLGDSNTTQITNLFAADDYVYFLDAVKGLFAYKVLDSTVIGHYGNVGIGTSNPEAKLEVNGNMVLNGVLIDGISTSGGLQNNNTSIPIESLVKGYVDSGDSNAKNYANSGDANVKKYADTGDANIKKYVDSVNSRIPKIASGVYLTTKNNQNKDPGTEEWRLDDGSDKVRRTVEKTILFRDHGVARFTNIPKVVVSINYMDIRDTGGNHRLQVSPKNITREKFTVVIQTWYDTEIYAAGASWFAFGI